MRLVPLHNNQMFSVNFQQRDQCGSSSSLLRNTFQNFWNLQTGVGLKLFKLNRLLAKMRVKF